MYFDRNIPKKSKIDLMKERIDVIYKYDLRELLARASHDVYEVEGSPEMFAVPRNNDGSLRVKLISKNSNLLKLKQPKTVINETFTIAKVKSKNTLSGTELKTQNQRFLSPNERYNLDNYEYSESNYDKRISGYINFEDILDMFIIHTKHKSNSASTFEPNFFKKYNDFLYVFLYIERVVDLYRYKYSGLVNIREDGLHILNVLEDLLGVYRNSAQYIFTSIYSQNKSSSVVLPFNIEDTNQIDIYEDDITTDTSDNKVIDAGLIKAYEIIESNKDLLL